jgi:hypothetical protein
LAVKRATFDGRECKMFRVRAPAHAFIGRPNDVVTKCNQAKDDRPGFRVIVEIESECQRS